MEATHGGDGYGDYGGSGGASRELHPVEGTHEGDT